MPKKSKQQKIYEANNPKKEKRHNIYTVTKDIMSGTSPKQDESQPGNIYEAFGFKSKKKKAPKKKTVKKKAIRRK